jgi:AcrR family transcriptional regulator
MHDAMPAGRPREFDEAAVLDAALRLFWTRGYSGVTFDEVARAMGLAKPSVYNAFGDKRVVFERAVERYTAVYTVEQMAALLDTSDAAEALASYLLVSARRFAEPGLPAGCLISSEWTHRLSRGDDPEPCLEDAMQRGLEAIVSRADQAVQHGRTPPDITADDLAGLVQTTTFGLSTMARRGVSVDQLERIAATVASIWRPQPANAE